MVSKLKQNQPRTPRQPPATTPELRENQLISAAVELAEKQILEGTASSQVITHYLKLGSSRERLEQQKMELEGELLRAKKEMMESQRRIEDLYAGAIEAMREYAGDSPPPAPEFEEEF